MKVLHTRDAAYVSFLNSEVNWTYQLDFKKKKTWNKVDKTENNFMIS